jgi:hypothetical protein
MEPRRKRTRWIVAAAVAALAVTVVLISPWSATATTGAPQVTVNASTNAGGKLTVSGQYSDPELVCNLASRPVTITTRTGSFSGPIVDTTTTTTGATGSYSKNTVLTTISGTTYYITVVVTGTVGGGYGASDVCPDATGTAQFTAP